MEQAFENIISEFINDKNFLKTKQYLQHGKTSVYDHAINVAYACFKYVKNKKQYDITSTIRGAMLHDYFLYDWHKRGHKKPHGITHPKVAYRNAMHDYPVNDIEKDIILKHMWPLTLFSFPKYKETWIVILMDKKETIKEMRVKK